MEDGVKVESFFSFFFFGNGGVGNEGRLSILLRMDGWMDGPTGNQGFNVAKVEEDPLRTPPS